MGSSAWNRFVSALMPLIIIGAVVIVWSLAVRMFRIPAYLLPSPEDIVGRIISDWRTLAQGTGYTLLSVVLGFALSVLVGIPIALMIVLNRASERVLMPIVVMSQTIPKVAIAPILIIWLGFGLLPKIAITFLITFFPIVVSTAVGLKSVELDMLDLVRSMGASRLKLVLRVRMPHALPNIFAGLKIAICLAVVGAIVGEFVGSDDGLGYLLLTSAGSLDGPLTWAALVILVAMGVILFSIIGAIERLVIPWHVSVRTDEIAVFQH